MERVLLAGVAAGCVSPLLRRPLRAGGGGVGVAGGGGWGSATGIGASPSGTSSSSRSMTRKKVKNWLLSNIDIYS